LSAKRLPLPFLHYAPTIKPKNTTINKDTASWNLQGVVFANPKAINNLPFCQLLKPPLHQQHSKPQDVPIKFVLQLGTHGIQATAGYVDSLNDSNQNVEKNLAAWFSECEQRNCSIFQLQEKDFELYAKIKQAGDFGGNHTICLAKQVGHQQHLSNLALKMNMKFSSDNHWLDEAKLEKLLGGRSKKQSTVIVGAPRQ